MLWHQIELKMAFRSKPQLNNQLPYISVLEILDYKEK